MRLTEKTALYTQNHFLWSLWNWKCAWPLIGYFKSEEMISEDILSTARRHKIAAECMQRLESSENMSLTSICKLSRFLKSTCYTFNNSKGMCIRVSSEGYRHGEKAGWSRQAQTLGGEPEGLTHISGPSSGLRSQEVTAFPAQAERPGAPTGRCPSRDISTHQQATWHTRQHKPV